MRYLRLERCLTEDRFIHVGVKASLFSAAFGSVAIK